MKQLRKLADGVVTPSTLIYPEPAQSQPTYIFLFLFTENVAALHDAWLVGDAFLRETFPTLQSIRTEAKSFKETSTLHL